MEPILVGEGKTARVYKIEDHAFKQYEKNSYDEIKKEADYQIMAWEAGLPVPQVFGVVNLKEGGIAIEMEYVQGQPLIRKGMDRDQRMQALEQLVILQWKMHQIETHDLPIQSQVLKQKINAVALEDASKASIIQKLNNLSHQKHRLCHGDFHPLNILQDEHSCWIIDWVDATCGDPLADACRTYLILKQYLTRMAGIYLRLYCKQAQVTQEEVLHWLPIIAAARLSENLTPQEKHDLVKLIDLL